MTALLEINDLRKSYGSVNALVGASLQVQSGEICALLGANGAGKSTMVSIVAGLMRPDSGSVTVNGVDAVAHSARAREYIGLASQELAIYPTVSVRDNLVMFGQLLGLRRQQLADRVTDAAARMDLTALLDRQARHLSGGEKRRLHTAVAILARPPLIILDEPTAGVDVSTRAQMIETVRQLAADEGCAVCYSTHYLGEVESLRASVAILDHGRIIARGEIDELVRQHARSAVELVFAGQPPALELDTRPEWQAEVSGNTLRIYGPDPTSIAAQVLGSLEIGRDQLRSVDFVTPSLEAVFLALTGRRWSADEGAATPDAPDGHDAAAQPVGGAR